MSCTVVNKDHGQPGLHKGHCLFICWGLGAQNQSVSSARKNAKLFQVSLQLLVTPGSRWLYLSLYTAPPCVSDTSVLS